MTSLDEIWGSVTHGDNPELKAEMLALFVASAAFAPSPLRPLAAAPAHTMASVPLMMAHDDRRPFVNAAAAMAASVPAVAFAEGEQGVNGAFKSAVADALGPDLAQYAGLIGTFLFVAIAALDLGIVGPKKQAKEEAPPPAPPAPSPADAAPPAEEAEP